MTGLHEGLEKVARGYTIVEGPAWDQCAGCLYFCDGFAGGVYALSDQGKLSLIIPKRRCSGIAIHEQGGLVVSGRNVGWKRGDESARLLELDSRWGMAYFNDLGTSISGRVYVGSVDYDFSDPNRANRPGFLHVIDLDGSSRIVGEGIGIANGIGPSPDGRLLYLNDTGHRMVRRYQIATNGDLRETDPLITFDNQKDGPDGLAIGADGSVWVALSMNDCIAVVSREGSELGRIDVPGHHVTSLCFGGSHNLDLYITTFHKSETEVDDSSIFRTRVKSPGMPVPMARVAIPCGSGGEADA